MRYLCSGSYIRYISSYTWNTHDCVLIVSLTTEPNWHTSIYMLFTPAHQHISIFTRVHTSFCQISAFSLKKKQFYRDSVNDSSSSSFELRSSEIESRIKYIFAISSVLTKPVWRLLILLGCLLVEDMLIETFLIEMIKRKKYEKKVMYLFLFS